MTRDSPAFVLRHPVTMLGIVLTTVSAVLFLLLWLLHTLGYADNPYVGLYAFVALPLLLALGLLLIPLGVGLGRRRVRRGKAVSPLPVWDFNRPRVRAVALVGVVLTIVNIALLGAAGTQAVHWMDSPRFCGQVCHTPMEPHFTQWQGAAHARVPCVSCHIGGGVGSFVEAKRSGTRQLWGVMRGTYARPIPTPVHNMRPAEYTCAQCHWPASHIGDRERTIHEFAADETNTPTTTVLRMKVGGGETGTATGIHWHSDPQVRIEYVATDAARETIPWVRLTTPDGRSREFVAEGVDPASVRGERRKMDCLDCHNRAAHPFAPSAEAVVDRALASGSLDRTLPFIRRETVKLLTSGGDDKAGHTTAIDRALREFYRTSYPAVAAARRADLDRSIRAAQDLYARHVFPTMKVSWGTYPNQAGHMTTPGCFRCHDDGHKAADGSVIRQDCELCHVQVADAS